MHTARSSATIRIALVGDYDPQITAHQAIPLALERAATDSGVRVDYQWLATPELIHEQQLKGFDGIWCVPGSPYRHIDGALLAIRVAREQQRPFLGTCGGFQHAVLEYARNVLGWNDAEHGEINPHAQRAVLTPLSCALVEARDRIQLHSGSRIAQAYGTQSIEEGYRCRYGVNPDFAGPLLSGALRPAGHDSDGDLRAVELDGHPFFVATLFQPERAALQGRTPPLVTALLNACLEAQG
ncbi:MULTISPECIES: CTP synthase C-terminal region-related (seleno)protein [Pseudomonas]|uniref:CTP synthase (glutamine hydrolyzing) n=1 Tax=Pseudomonas idahonensis TaxID=2942628 RepID=A0ABT5QCT6_9PSED|nr:MULTISPECIES: CTP synthase [Pseudomonas]MDD1151551.1 CTP synthase [Pseudomonas idahonensis]MDP9517431.1 CTP synthase [Pseudomonas protegens]